MHSCVSNSSRPLRAAVEFLSRRLVSPLHLSSGRIDEVLEARATVEVDVGGRVVSGKGAIYLSDLWAWPDPQIEHVEREARMRDLCMTIAAQLPQACGGEAAHPTELGLRLHDSITDNKIETISLNMPRLARLLCASPFDAAIHDAVGLALNRSSLDLYEGAELPSADRAFASPGAAAAIHRLLDRPSVRAFPATFVIGAHDELAPLLDEWVDRRRYRRVKLKLNGRDPRVDAIRTIEVVRELQGRGISSPWLSVDTNEASHDAACVLEYLERLSTDSPPAYAALQYLEQPTSRDIARDAHDWRRVSRHKPILLDEGLVSLEDLPEAIRQGWSGLAIKTCKGHSFSLLAAAWAYERGLLLALQDLTNPGGAAIHSALLGMRLPTLNGLELNSPQFTPQANEEWLPRWAPLLAPVDGWHRLPDQNPPGLGYNSRSNHTPSLTSFD
ncbi:MAG: enolase C-terminal domain-like protein [Pirellulales bacterium]